MQISTSNQIIFNGEGFDLSDLNLDERGQVDLPPSLTAEACGCSTRTMQKKRAKCGDDYRKHYYYMLNRPGTTRPPQERSWMRALVAWASRQGLDI
jgi:hypothetical protein